MKWHLSNILNPGNNLVNVVSCLVDLLDAKITRTTLEKEITAHPDYPSLLSISDALTNHGIENITAKFDAEKYKDLPTPFITQLTDNGITYFTVVKEINSVYIRLFDIVQHNWVKRYYNDFVKKVSGIVLLIKPKKGIREHDYKSKFWIEKRNKWLPYFIKLCLPGIVLVSGILAFQQIGFSFILPFLLSLILLTGIGLTVLLLWYEIDYHSPVLQQICSIGKNTDCGAILQSKGAKVLGISWSAIGFIYFSGSLLLLLSLGIVNPNALHMLSYFSLFSIPFIFYSIFYQWKVAKKWCVLCLSVQALLVLQCSLNLVGKWYFVPIDNSIVQILPQILSSFVIPFILVGLLLPALKKSIESNHITRELQELKYDPEIFNTLLNRQRSVTNTPEGLGVILGNPDAKNTIIKVCNPYCNPCAQAHRPLKDLMKNNQDIKMQIIFTTNNSEGDIKTAPVKHLLAIWEKKDTALISRALDDWYLSERKDYQVFAVKYPVNEEFSNQENMIKAMSNWCKANKIQYTPTFFINGHQLPPNYSAADLKYVLSS